MMAVKTPFKSGILDRKLKDLRLAIEELIPVGFNAYKESVDESSYWDGWKDFSELHEGVHDRKAKALKQLGTLGGGNHFIEVCLDTENFVWLMLHSGSRNIGKELAERHISTAKSLWRLSQLPAPDLAYLIHGTPEFAAYWKDLKWAQTYAIKNSVYVLPANEKTHEDFQWLKQEIESEGGDATVFQAASVEGATDDEIIAAFRKARDEEFAAITAELDGLTGAIRGQTRGKHLSAGRLAAHETEIDKLHAELERISVIDFFGAGGRQP